MSAKVYERKDEARKPHQPDLIDYTKLWLVLRSPKLKLKNHIMRNRKTYQIMAQRIVVGVLENNRPDLSEDLSEEDCTQIEIEYNKILDRLEKLATKNGGKFNRFRGQ